MTYSNLWIRKPESCLHLYIVTQSRQSFISYYIVIKANWVIQHVYRKKKSSVKMLQVLVTNIFHEGNETVQKNFTNIHMYCVQLHQRACILHISGARFFLQQCSPFFGDTEWIPKTMHGGRVKKSGKEMTPERRTATIYMLVDFWKFMLLSSLQRMYWNSFCRDILFWKESTVLLIVALFCCMNTNIWCWNLSYGWDA